MASGAQSVKCVILTLRSENVMVPNAAIAEIISARDTLHIDNTPNWYVGKMPWRDVDVPLVSFAS